MVGIKASFVLGPENRVVVLCLALALCAIFWIPAASAQEAHEGQEAQEEERAPQRRAFRTFAIGVGGVGQVYESDLNADWSSPAGVEVYLGTPFYAGRVKLGAQIVPYAAETEDVPAFRSNYLFSEWQFEFALLEQVSATAGFRIGVLHMDFEGLTGAARTEREVAARAVAGLRYRTGPWAAYLQGSYGSVVLSHPIQQAHVTLGISRSFSTPAWLQEALL